MTTRAERRAQGMAKLRAALDVAAGAVSACAVVKDRRDVDEAVSAAEDAASAVQDAIADAFAQVWATDGIDYPTTRVAHPPPSLPKVHDFDGSPIVPKPPAKRFRMCSYCHRHVEERFTLSGVTVIACPDMPRDLVAVRAR